MCGIAGIVHFGQGLVDSSKVKTMIDTLAHRGPDGEGIWTDKHSKVCFGHRRLSIIDLSDNASQPMHYLGRYTITFNGEIYNYIELREELKKAGFNFHTESDTEVLLAGYHHYREKILDKLDGMFAFSLYDEQEGTVFCARDRFGEKPFFYTQNGNDWFFGSEMKALFRAGIKPELNYQMLFLFLAHELVENPADKGETFFSNVKKLEASHYLLINVVSGHVLKKRYWSLNDIKLVKGITFEEASATFRNLFFNSVAKRLRSDVAVGSSLSGGLDSSSVVLAIDQIPRESKNNHKQHTFSGRFLDPSFDEGYFIDLVTKNTMTQNHPTWPSLNGFWEEAAQIVWHQEEPMTSSSPYAQWEVYKLAKEKGVSVLLDGQGSDEILAGYSHFFIDHYRERLRQGNFSQANTDLNNFLLNNPGQVIHIPGFRIFFQTLFPHSFSLLATLKHKAFGTEITGFLHPDLSKKFDKSISPFKIFYSLDDALLFYTTVYGLEKLLRFADRNSMAFSREVRLPFLSHELVEFLFSLPSDFKIREGWTKAILRNGMKDILPSEIAWRKTKLGFELPEQKWLRTETSKENFIPLKQLFQD